MQKNTFTILGIIGIAICAAAWAIDIWGLVYACPYCRVERTVIGILGLALILPMFHSVLYIFTLNIMAWFGIVTAMNQNFKGWVHISDSAYGNLLQPIYENAFVLSMGAMILISIQIICLNGLRFPKLKSVFTQDQKT